MTIYPDLRTANAARQTEWDPTGLVNNMGHRMNELAGEIGEFCNVIKKFRRAELDIPGSRADLEMYTDELGDVVICLDLLLMTLDERSAVPDLPSLQAFNPEIAIGDSGVGLRIFRAAGLLFTTVELYEASRRTSIGLSAFHRRILGLSETIMTTCYEAAMIAKVDLPCVVADKFNKTSRVRGFDTLLR
jgi:NTP pyrophosphatase (non-canonical NTP hydrolase)